MRSRLDDGLLGEGLLLLIDLRLLSVGLLLLLSYLLVDLRLLSVDLRLLIDLRLLRNVCLLSWLLDVLLNTLRLSGK